ncbi:BTAD domain-containing putative transcriptional regulator [Ktedonospora formicarum]|uniref:Bacterial transcriptional activator domain-containing protein n=1 Tax=Ktedonospora formicarum TaxID=2778364 RepID=A0A8J3I710_9CHLR|nr:BTAD domain-containing putative transcriptional regulator [Ktedonospora formicarum]GHO48015.1 hypothetical protein KSX_61780 [Ktedonospora formicarum]
MNDLLNQRKITCPPLTATHVHRDGLVQKLINALGESGMGTEKKVRLRPYKLVLLQAPAGYGKTTLLTDFAHQTTLPCCWYILDHTDADRMTFLTVLLASIRQCFPNFGSALDSLLNKNSLESRKTGYFERTVDAFASAIEAEIPERFALLLCNYQEINDLEEMNHLIGSLLKKLPPQCTIIIESRVIPALNFAWLLAKQMLFGVGVDQLRFTAQEIHQLAQLQGVEPLSDAEANQLALAFNGWVAGILLGTHLSHISQFQQNLMTSPFTDIPTHQAASEYLFSYVVNEVFQKHEDTYAFLKEVSILQEMHPATCAELLDIPPTEALHHLQYLEQQNLFVTHNGEGPNVVYICAPVLRKLFIEELRHETPERFFYLHQRAAELLSRAHNYKQAIYHALEAKVNDTAASLIVASSEQMMSQGNMETVARWIDAFPLFIMKRYPKLLLIRANIYLGQGNIYAALPLVESAESAIQTLMTHNSPLHNQNLPTLQAEASIMRSKILFRQREYSQSMDICQQVLTSLPVDEVRLRAEALTRLGVGHILLGDFASGIAHIQKALQLWGRHTIQREAASGHSVLARAYCLQGNFSLAEHHMSRAIACWEKLEEDEGKVDNLVRLGNIKVRQGAFEEAEPIFQQALTLARGPLHYLRGEAYVLDCLGIFYQRQERYEAALETTEEALALARQLRDQGLIYDALCDLAMIYLAMGDTATALILISEAEVQTTSGNSIGYEQALRDLIFGTIYLYQGYYSKAWPYLIESEATLRTVGLKQEHLRALLCLASYHILQGQTSDAIERLKAAARIITICEGYEQLARQEISRLPGLSKAFANPEFAREKALFHLSPDSQITTTDEEQNSIQEKQRPTQSAPLVTPAIETTGPITSSSSPTQSALTITAFGEPVVAINKEPITRWRMARAMELFFYLLDCGRPMRKEVIITALWPDVDEQTTRTFYSTIYYLRQALGGEAAIVAKGGTYMFRPEALYGKSVWYDVETFLDAQVQAKQALEEEDDDQAKASFTCMVELYRGDYVQPFYSDWSTIRRDELRRAYLDARQQLALLAWQVEELDESIIHWQHMLAIDEWLEEAHYGLMRCYARQGKRGLALRQYQRCKDALEQEFGAAPPANIQNLYQRLMG